MDPSQIYFLLFVVLDVVVQSITGFAMGLIIMGGVAAMGLADISLSAVVVSLISLCNKLVALRYNHRDIDFEYVKRIATGMLPMALVGVTTLTTSRIAHRIPESVIRKLVFVLLVLPGGSLTLTS